jgi:hypothetical protein
MGRFGIAVMVCALGIGFGSAAAGQSPAPNPTPPSGPVGQRVEAPGEGFALTFPAGWSVGVASAPPQTTPDGRAMPRAAMGAIPIFPIAISAKGPGWQERIEQCRAGSFPYIGLTPNDIAVSLAIILLEPDTFSAEPVSLPAGEAAHLAATKTVDGRVVHQSAYVVAKDAGYLWLWCVGLDEWPDDDWRSIAETIEMLAPEASLPPGA